MNEFEYQMYLSKLESIKGTKNPITKFIKELYDKYRLQEYIADIQTTALVYKLVSRAIAYSSAVNPTTHSIHRWCNEMPRILLNSQTIMLSDKQWVELFEFPVQYTISLNPASIAELLELDRRVNLITPGPNTPGLDRLLRVSLNMYSLKFVRDSSKIDAVARAIIAHYNPNSVLLERLRKDDVTLTIGLESIKEFIEQITPILKDHNELINSSSTTE
jgi:hypothetical protein